jgi:hypothetical protein
MSILPRGEISCQFLPKGSSMGLNIFCSFYFEKNHKIVINSTATKAREKISTDMESQEFCINFDVHLTKFKTNQI